MQRFLLSPRCTLPTPFGRLGLIVLLSALVGSAGASAASGELQSPSPRVRSSSERGATDIDRAVKIQSALLQQFQTQDRQDYAIELKERADLSAAAGLDWNARGRYVVEQLKATAERSQAALRRELEGQGLRVESHWIKNVLLVRGGDQASVKAAANHPGVSRIRDLPQADIIRPEPGKAPKRKSAGSGMGIADNIAWIGADQAWAQGTRGNGVTVGVIDTGAYYEHNALRRQYRGWRGGDVFEHDYNWFSPTGEPEPVSAAPHGSHVIGTIVGDDFAEPGARNQIGVAPGAEWIACLGLQIDANNTDNLLSCGEFMLAPTRTDGSDPNPDLRPQVVNNSWSEQNCNGEATSFYSDVIDAWVAAGIFPVFAAGNAFNCGLPEPAGLSTISSPASLAAAFAVGSTGNHDGQFAAHSLWGPSNQSSPGLPTLPDPRGYPQLKPQVVAPGVNIVSVDVVHIDHYSSMTGTSMSAPHISGLAALMLEAGECLRGDYPRLGGLIMSSARPLPYPSFGDPAPGPGDVPNYATGWGEIDAIAAVQAAAAACGPQGFVAGHIRDADGNPIGGARIELFVDQSVRIWELYSEPDGTYIRRLPEALDSGYQLRVSAYGYLAAQRHDLRVHDGETITADFALDQAPLVTLSGKVSDAVTGWPLHARLRIAGYPDGPIWSDPVSGHYSVQLPLGARYRIDLDSDIPGYLPSSAEVDLSAGMSRDLQLQANPTTCAAPGYGYGQQFLQQDFEAGHLPAGWTMESAGIGWRFGGRDELQNPIDWPIPHRTGRFAAATDAPNNDARQDHLISPPIDLRAAVRPALRFSSYFWSGSLLTKGASVQASIDDGLTWTAVGAVPQNRFAWTEQAMSLAPFAGHIVKLRLRFEDGSNDEYELYSPGWAVDDLAVMGACSAAPTGGLVVGQVRDANSAEPLDGAELNLGSQRGYSFSSEDPAVGSGFFALWSPPGAATLQASRGNLPVGYGDATAELTVANGQTLGTDLALPAARLRFDPASGPQATVELGQVVEVPFGLHNDGSLPLSYALEGQHLEEHFDHGVPAHWSLDGDGISCPWSLAHFDNSAGGDGNAAGVYPYLCGDSGRIDTRLTLPPVDLSDSQSASIGFFLAFHQGPGTDSQFDVEVSTDAGASWTSVFSEVEDTTPREPFNLIERDLSAFAGQADVRIRLRYQSTLPWGDVQVDQIHLFRQLGADQPLSITPPNGLISAGSSVAATARFDASEIAQPGTYEISVRVAEDTPYDYPYGALIGTMTVTAPPGWGSVSGTARSLGRCEVAPAALANHPLRIRAANGDQIIINTDFDGNYLYWLDAARGPYTVEMEADGHVAVQRTLTLQAGQQAQLDIDARPLQACVLADPTSLSHALPRLGQGSRQFNLLNIGAATGLFNARVGGNPELASAMRLSQNLSSEPEPFVSFGCVDPSTGYSLENRWLRVFNLAERGLGGSTAWIDGLHFGADSTASGLGSQPVRVSLYRLNGPMQRSNLALLARTTVLVDDTELSMFEVSFDDPVEVPLDATVVIEVSIDDGRVGGNTYFPAGNRAPNTAPAYYESAACGIHEPMSYDDLRFDDQSPILELDIRASDACGNAAIPVGWLAVTPANGEVAADSGSTLTAAFNANGLSNGLHQAAICIEANGVTDGPNLLPVQLDVGGSLHTIHADGFE